ncbi:MAG: hypothetical protein GY739_20965 [Mesoflavibacter sp.]|nr:hypothetical protein [Mesoflavibacter sp.]
MKASNPFEYFTSGNGTVSYGPETAKTGKIEIYCSFSKDFASRISRTVSLTRKRRLLLNPPFFGANFPSLRRRPTMYGKRAKDADAAMMPFRRLAFPPARKMLPAETASKRRHSALILVVLDSPVSAD